MASFFQNTKSNAQGPAYRRHPVTATAHDLAGSRTEEPMNRTTEEPKNRCPFDTDPPNSVT